MAQRKKQLIAEGKLDKHGRPNAETPKEYLRALPDVGATPATAEGDDAAAPNGQAEAVSATPCGQPHACPPSHMCSVRVSRTILLGRIYPCCFALHAVHEARAAPAGCSAAHIDSHLLTQAVKDEPAAEANGTAEAAAEGSEKKKKKKVRVCEPWSLQSAVTQP